MRDITARVQRIEERFEAPACPECRGVPVRMIGTDDAGNVTSATDPEDGCELCGTAHRVVVVLPGVNVDAL